jgi:hypothetical protein
VAVYWTSQVVSQMTKCSGADKSPGAIVGIRTISHGRQHKSRYRAGPRGIGLCRVRTARPCVDFAGNGGPGWRESPAVQRAVAPQRLFPCPFSSHQSQQRIAARLLQLIHFRALTFPSSP